MEDLKKQLTEILKTEKIYFSFEYQHKAHFVEIHGADQISDDLEYWIGHEVLVQYLLDKNIYYNFEGSFILKDEKILICISFSGPYDDEFEPVTLPVEIILSDKTVKKEIEKAISTELDYSAFLVQFKYEESGKFNYLNLTYWNEISNQNEIVDYLNSESISIIKNKVKEFIQNNVPILNLPKNIKQKYFCVASEENRIKYYISTSEMTIEWEELKY